MSSQSEEHHTYVIETNELIAQFQIFPCKNVLMRFVYSLVVAINIKREFFHKNHFLKFQNSVGKYDFKGKNFLQSIPDTV